MKALPASSVGGKALHRGNERTYPRQTAFHHSSRALETELAKAKGEYALCLVRVSHTTAQYPELNERRDESSVRHAIRAVLVIRHTVLCLDKELRNRSQRWTTTKILCYGWKPILFAILYLSPLHTLLFSIGSLIWQQDQGTTKATMSNRIPQPGPSTNVPSGQTQYEWVPSTCKNPVSPSLQPTDCSLLFPQNNKSCRRHKSRVRLQAGV